MTARPRLTVIGTGYLGATHAVCLAELGVEVLGIDVLPEKVEALQSGRVPFYEPGLPELLQKNLEAGRLRFTTSYMARAGELGVDQALSFLKEVDAINLRRRARMIDLARAQVGGSFGGIKVAVLGAAFKPNSDDIRDSPALDVAASIQKQGAAVCVYDPEAMHNARVKHPELGYRESAVEAARGADIVLHLTEWSEFREMDPAVLSEVVAQKHIVDGRNALDPETWRAAGWTYRALGRP